MWIFSIGGTLLSAAGIFLLGVVLFGSPFTGPWTDFIAGITLLTLGGIIALHTRHMLKWDSRIRRSVARRRRRMNEGETNK